MTQERCMPFNHCAECQSCCRIDAGYPPLEITLNKTEKNNFGRLCIEDSCEHLGDAGCTLGDNKPFACQLYPLAYDPKNEAFFFDPECPLMPEYRHQLNDPHSEASTHLKHVSEVIRQLSVKEASFLKKNFQVDSEYFDLQPLETSNFNKKVGA